MVPAPPQHACASGKSSLLRGEMSIASVFPLRRSRSSRVQQASLRQGAGFSEYPLSECP